MLKADPVLGPLLSYCRCILKDGSVHAYDVCSFGEPDGACISSVKNDCRVIHSPGRNWVARRPLKLRTQQKDRLAQFMELPPLTR